MRNRYLYFLRIVLILCDLIIVNGCYWACYYLINSVWDGKLRLETYTAFISPYNLIWLVTVILFRMYHDETVRKIERLMRSTWKSVVMLMLLFSLYLFLTKNYALSRQFILFLFASLSVGFFVSRFIITVLENSKMQGRSRYRVSVAVMGFNDTGIKLAEYFGRHASEFRFEGILDEGDKTTFINKNSQQLHDVIRKGVRLAALRSIDEVYASVPPAYLVTAHTLVEEAEKQCVKLKVVPDLNSVIAAHFQIRYMNDFPVLSLRQEPLENLHNRFKKRLFDIVFSSLVIILILSWLYPIIALLIKLQSPGPVLFKQKRSGRNNKPFTCYKFRSMRVNKDSEKVQATKNDSRITPIGSFLRRSSLDELPQFFNVLKGEMSVVGPRPHMLAHTEQYRTIIDQFMVRHFLKPGITGWAQVSGFRGETKEVEQMEKRIQKDIWYLENWSLMLDIRIIYLTLYQVIRGDEKAY
ncbi:MAG TPA: undecaprenyl-phosphate glucose phosphotransferase [Chitinophagaceae bacterium]|nr:undecaprenyl-phosphate glucose phosphotransferase [Chitinophagaceae bacterium]